MATRDDSLIQVHDLKKHYHRGAIKALDGVTVDINKGDVMVVIGPSGSGKSTFLRSLNLLEEPTDGEIIFNGVDITKKKYKDASGKTVKLDIDSLRQKMGMVFQHFNLFPHMTILENMTLAPMKVKGVSKEEAEKNAENQKKKEFYTTDMSLLNQPEDFHISDYYITNKVIAGNRYYVDENHVLWGQGMNYYAQLGINHPEDVGNWYHEEYMEPQKIAEHVVHVDASANGYFMMYLTENGELYGAGANLQGVLGKEPGENDAMNPQQNVVNQPKLLMSDVAYMRAGATCVIALKKNGEVYWWGEFMSGEASSIYGEGTLMYTEPHKMLNQAIYVTTTNRRSAAITVNGDLYTWGDNTYGQCGYTGEKTFLTEPEKVMENVRMVWCDEIEQNAIWTNLANVNPNDYGTTSYDDTFVLKKDGKMYAAGTNIGTDSKRNTPYGEGEDDERSDENKCTTYSAKFLPIEVKEYVPESNPTEEYTGEKKIQIEGTAAEGLAE